MHNYSSANSYAQKQYNWNTLNKKVLRKMGFQLHPSDIDDVIKATPGAVEKVFTFTVMARWIVRIVVIASRLVVASERLHRTKEAISNGA